MLAITDREVPDTTTEAPGIGSLLLLITLPERTTIFCPTAPAIKPADKEKSNKDLRKIELRIVQFDEAKFLSVRNPDVISILTNYVLHVKPMLSAGVVVDK
jgi:aspartate carbamoyltransferase regulatory subunit